MFSFISSFLETPESGTSTPEDFLKAVTSDNVERASYVLSRSVNVNTPLDLQNNDTALHIAARKGLKAMATCLIDNGADLHALNTDNFTPLHCSILAADGSLGVATLLLERGAETHRQGNTFQLITAVDIIPLLLTSLLITYPHLSCHLCQRTLKHLVIAVVNHYLTQPHL